LIAWPANSFVNFHFAADFPEAYKDRLREVASVWKNSRGESIIKFSNSPRSSSSSQSDGLNIIYWVDDASRFQTNEQGRTIVRSRNSQIIDADIMVNADSFEYFIDPPSNGIKVHAPSLMVHEFGHALGLRHIPFQESLMYSHLGFMQIRVEPQEIDKTALRCKY
ncbi:MAG: matrixin family metalloprotease, partial [Bdellovibrionales bacterium]